MTKRRMLILSNKKYEIEFIARGGFAEVYKATPISDRGHPGEPVAIKKISKTDDKWRRHKEYVRREIDIHEILDHPNIVKLLDVVKETDAIYLILELCSMTLHDYVNERKPDFDESMVFKIFKQIVDGVQYLHPKLIIHRDLTLKNILLTKDMQVKIADFGLSTALKEDDEPKYTVCGTSGYMPPEIRGKKKHGQKADIWNLGCILKELLLKIPPDRGKEQKFSDEANELLKDLLENSPAKRICIEKVPESKFFKKYEWNYRLKNRSDDSGNGSRNHLSSPIEKESHFRSLDSGFNSKNPSRMNSKSSRKKDYSEKKVAERRNFDLRKDKLSTPKHYLSSDRTHDHKRSASEDRKPFKALHNQSVNSRERSASAERKQIVDSKSPYYRDYANDACQIISRDCYKSQDWYKKNDCGINSAWKIHGSCNPEPTEHCNDPSCRFSNSLPKGQHKVSPSTCSHTDCCDTKCSHVATCCCHSHSYRKHHLKNINYPEKLNEHSLEQLTSPLNAVRLRPKRHMPKDLNNTVLHISADGQVIVEVLKTKKRKVYVSEVFIISTDGMEIKIYKPPRNTLLDDDRPPPIPNDSREMKFYYYQKLPRIYHEKYLVAKRFVDILRVKTPKLIINGQNAKFYVMENSPDPDMKMEFYDGGSVIKKGQIISITDMHGRNCVVHDGTRNLDQNFKSMLEEFLSEKEDCEAILKFHESRRPRGFPIIIGTAKDDLNCSGPKSRKENFAPTSSKTNRGQRT